MWKRRKLAKNWQQNTVAIGKLTNFWIARKRLASLGIIALVCSCIGTFWFLPVKAASKTHQIMSTPQNAIWGELFKPNSRPIARVRSGDRVVMQTISHEGILPDQGDTVAFLSNGGIPQNPKSRVAPNQVLQDQLIVKAKLKKTGPGPHVITGPIYVEGAEPGDVLEIKTIAIAYRSPYGVISNRHGRGALPDEYPLNGAPLYSKVIAIDTKREVGIFQLENNLPALEIPLKPFMGIMGVVPANLADAANSIPPGLYGGNVDIKLLGRGSSLYVPVQVPGALFYSGDPHCAQANGEVALTAIECSLTPTFELVVHKNMQLTAPMGETKDAWIAVGLDKDLDEAMKKSVREYLQIANQKYGMSKQDALMFGSAAIDFDVSQVVDIVKGIHGTIPKQMFQPLEKA